MFLLVPYPLSPTEGASSNNLQQDFYVSVPLTWVLCRRETYGSERALIPRYSWSLKIFSDLDKKNDQMPPKGGCSDTVLYNKCNSYREMSVET